MRRWISFVISTFWLRDVPGGMICCMAKSPSSSVGMNSPPMRVKAQMLTAKSTAVAATTGVLSFSES